MNANRGQLILGAILAGLGVVLLLGNILGINVWAIVWSAGLIILGVVLLVRPRLARAGTRVDFTLIGDTKLAGTWQAQDEEFWTGIGDVKLDYTQAALPEGETTVRIYCLIGDVDFVVPAGLGINLVTSGVFTELKVRGDKQEGFLRPLSYTSPDYSSAARRIRVEVMAFISDTSIN